MVMMDPALAAETAAFSRQKALKEALRRGDSDVSAFFKDSVVFITGASGFLGKQLVEKLLRCTDVSKIYLLLRGKKGRSAKERLDDILLNPVYSSLRQEKPEFSNKIVAIEGDVSQMNVGLNDNDWELLSNEVNVIFHGAATVHFEAPIRSATLTNVRGTREVLKLARDCKHLKSMVYVSTAYAYATRSRVRSRVMEHFYKSPMRPDDLIRLAEASDQLEFEDIQKKWVGSDWPNTYTLTKAVTEELIRLTATDLPLCIVRPTIVVPAFREPSPGWVDEKHVFGASGLVLGVTMGIIHTMLAKSENSMDYVPVDVVNNAIVAAAWETAGRSERLPKIYTVTNTRNPGSWENLIGTLRGDVVALASPRAVWYCGGGYTRHAPLFQLLALLLHYIPACVADAACLLVGKKPRFLKLYRKVGALSNVLCYFLMNDWYFDDENIQQLYKRLSPTDKDLYNFDMCAVDYRELIIIWHLGVRKYIVKDGLRDTAYGVRKQQWLKILNHVLFPIYLYVLYRLLCVVVYFVCFVFNKIFVV